MSSIFSKIVNTFAPSKNIFALSKYYLLFELNVCKKFTPKFAQSLLPEHIPGQKIFGPRFRSMQTWEQTSVRVQLRGPTLAQIYTKLKANFAQISSFPRVRPRHKENTSRVAPLPTAGGGGEGLG